MKECNDPPYFKVTLCFREGGEPPATTFEVAGESGAGWETFLAPLVDKHAAFHGARVEDLCVRVRRYSLSKGEGLSLTASRLRLIPLSEPDRASTPWQVKIQASKVAEILGRHKYRSREIALIEVLLAQTCGPLNKLQRDIRADVELWKRLAFLKTETIVEAAVLHPKQQAVEEDASLVAASKAPELATERLRRAAEERTQAAKAEDLRAQRLEKEADAIAKVLVEEAFKGANPNEVGAVKAKCAAKKAQVARASAEAHAVEAQVLREAASNPKTVETALGAASSKRRGDAQEASVLDDVAKRHCAEVTQRNERFRFLRGERYELCGKVDGLTENGDGSVTVVEAKTRRNWFAAPPEYDVIQLRVYLRMVPEACRGWLTEKKQDDEGCFRCTEVLDDEDEWKIIHEGLESAAGEIQNATLDTVRVWSEVAILSRDARSRGSVR